MPEWTYARTTDLRYKSKLDLWWILKTIVFLACLVPMVLLVWATANGQLSANPLEDIRNTQKIAAVVLNGRYFSRTDLDEMLAGVEKAAGDPTSKTSAKKN